jgi:hypothetical protein
MGGASERCICSAQRRLLLLDPARYDGVARSEGPYLENYNLLTPLTLFVVRRTNGQRSLIIDDDISIDAEAKKKKTTKTTFNVSKKSEKKIWM